MLQDTTTQVLTLTIEETPLHQDVQAPILITFPIVALCQISIFCSENYYNSSILATIFTLTSITSTLASSSIAVGFVWS